MTKKDYEMIAKRMKSTKNTYGSVLAREIIDDASLALAEVFKEDNERFDVNKFLTACGYLKPDQK